MNPSMRIAGVDDLVIRPSFASSADGSITDLLATIQGILGKLKDV
jgi:hypothetical protein